MRKFLWLVGCGILMAACDYTLPTSPSRVFGVQSMPTSGVPSNRFAETFTALTPGATVQRRVTGSPGSDDNPTCPDLPGWGCQFFRLSSEVSGRLEATLTRVVETQPNQGLDLSLDRNGGGAIWSHSGPGGSQVLDVSLDAGEICQLVVWYTSPGVEFELHTAFSPR